MKRYFGFAMTLALAAALAVPAIAQAQDSGEKWLHVRVEKTGEDGELVRVNVPLSLAEAVIPAIKSHGLRHGKLRFHQHTKGIDLHALLSAVRDAQDGEYVTVEKRGETIRVAKSGGFLLVNTDETDGEAGKRVNVKIPLVVVEALLSGDEEELDLGAALKALRDFGDIELVTVRDGDETVRVWIDSNSSGQ